MRSTCKSTFELIPKREKLVEEFNKPFNQKSKLSSGARAVTKHSDRARQSNMWGKISGNEEKRNENSNLICLDIIANAIWISVFELNSTTTLIEIRNDEGFGLRWDYYDYNNCVFKGLVEPQNEKKSPADIKFDKEINLNKNKSYEDEKKNIDYNEITLRESNQQSSDSE